MIDIYRGCKFDDLYINSDVAVNKAIIYNVATNSSKEMTLTLRTGTTYTYDMSLTATDTKTLHCGVYSLEFIDSDNRMILNLNNYIRVVQSSKQNA